MTEPLARAINAIGEHIDDVGFLELENAATAALCAVRNPSTAMIDAGAARIPGSDPRAAAERVWRAMHKAMMLE